MPVLPRRTEYVALGKALSTIALRTPHLVPAAKPVTAFPGAIRGGRSQRPLFPRAWCLVRRAEGRDGALTMPVRRTRHHGFSPLLQNAPGHPRQTRVYHMENDE